MVPYTLDTNDMRFATPQGFNTGDQFSPISKTLRRAVRRGRSSRPRRAEDAVDRHALPARRPAGAGAALARFVDYARGHPDVWFARRIDIARHWQSTHPFAAVARRVRPARRRPEAPRDPGRTQRAAAGGIRRRAGRRVRALAVGSRSGRSRRGRSRPSGAHAATVAAVAAAGAEAQLALLRAHPELAGRAMIRSELTADSSQEQAGAGLAQCSPDEYARLQDLNARYHARFGFPFIVAVKGLDRAQILERIAARIANDPHHRVPRGAVAGGADRPLTARLAARGMTVANGTTALDGIGARIMRHADLLARHPRCRDSVRAPSSPRSSAPRRRR